MNSTEIVPDQPSITIRRARIGVLAVARRAAVLLVAAAFPAFSQYAGPAILSRGEAPEPLMSPQLTFQPYIGAQAYVDTGLAGVAVGSQGQLINTTGEGGALVWGVSGRHTWRHTRLGVVYTGDYYRYDQSSYNTIDQSAMIGLSQQFTRHASLTLRESMGSFSRSFTQGYLSETVPFDPANSYVPTTDFFDNRTSYLTTQADFILQKSARLSIDLGGDAFIVRRASSALTGSMGESARGDFQYRVTRRSTLGAGYNYMHFGFTRADGGTDVHSAFGSYSTLFSRTVELTGNVGVDHVESKFLTVIPVDPIIAALLGISGAPEITHFLRTMPVVHGRLSKKFGRGYGYIGGQRMIVPGNGLFMTSYQTEALAGYSYTGIRGWSISSALSFATATATGSITGNYKTLLGSAAISHRIARGVQGTATFSARQYSSPNYTNYDRVIYRGQIGFVFAPGDIPLRFW
jgi:hypothetical protein